MDQEPHHHLALENDYVKVFNVEVAPGESVVLHSHDKDTVAIAIGDQLVTVGVPGKPDVQQKNADAQVRLQASGYRHSTHVDGNTPYHTVAVELMQPQTNFHNLCAQVLADQPLNCQNPPASPAYAAKPLLASGETEVRLVSVHAHQTMKVEVATAAVIVALDPAMISSGADGKPEKTLKAGDFVWLTGGTAAGRAYQNQGDKDARLIEFTFASAK
jgi:quercetin dioxygenase-like cupin family protein